MRFRFQFLFIWMSCISALEARPRRGSDNFPTTQGFLINLGLGALVVLIVGGVILFLRKRKMSAEEPEFKFEVDQSAKRKSFKKNKPAPVEDPVDPSISKMKKDEKPPPEMIVTEKTRVQMNNMLSSITAIKPIEPPPKKEEPPIDLKALEDSAIVEALAKTMISEPQSENSQSGKFSKMTIDAVLLFDEEDLKTGTDPEKN